MLAYELYCPDCGNNIIVPFFPPAHKDHLEMLFRCSRCIRTYRIQVLNAENVPLSLKLWSENWESRFVILFDEAVRLADTLQVQIDLVEPPGQESNS